MPQQRRGLEDPWLPIVLSLDGGGVRGLSALYILRRIMRRIQEKTKVQNDDPVANAIAAIPPVTRTQTLTDRDMPSSPGPRRSATMPASQECQTFVPKLSSPVECDAELPLPCCYFDFMVGTSTGGLIAVMLGRLRMSIDDAIKQYWILSNDIFRPRPLRILYDATKLEESIKKVVREFCGCHPKGRRCGGEGINELLRQYDYAEEGDPGVPHRLNYSCKVALVAQRRKHQGGDATWLFRSYNHNPRLENWQSELNPKQLGKGSAKIWEACRASSAAPRYFKEMVIDGTHYMDGGVGNNNPADLAWNEAKWMSNRSAPHSGEVRALVSLGTGKSRAETRFGMLNLLRWSKRAITETQRVHEAVRNTAMSSGAAYWRFDVKPEEGFHDGLADVNLSDCKRRKIAERTSTQRQQELAPVSTTSSEMNWHRDLQEKATEERDDRGRRRRGGYKPDKYAYETFDLIFEQTEYYCTHSQYDDNTSVEQAINDCAELLLRYARRRLLQNPARFRRFVSHPHPEHEKYLKPFPGPRHEPVEEEDEEGDEEGDSGVDLEHP